MRRRREEMMMKKDEAEKEENEKRDLKEVSQEGEMPALEMEDAMKEENEREMEEGNEKMGWKEMVKEEKIPALEVECERKEENERKIDEEDDKMGGKEMVKEEKMPALEMEDGLIKGETKTSEHMGGDMKPSGGTLSENFLNWKGPWPGGGLGSVKDGGTGNVARDGGRKVEDSISGGRMRGDLFDHDPGDVSGLPRFHPLESPKFSQKGGARSPPREGEIFLLVKERDAHTAGRGRCFCSAIIGRALRIAWVKSGERYDELKDLIMQEVAQDTQIACDVARAGSGVAEDRDHDSWMKEWRLLGADTTFIRDGGVRVV